MRFLKRPPATCSLTPLRAYAEPVSWRLLGAAFVAWAVSAALAFRFVLLSGFDVIMGDGGDGRMILYLHEHLFNVLQGRAAWLSPPFFYPQRSVLGFTDAFLLDALPYATLRAVGLDPYLSFQIGAIALSFCCFLASLLIGRRYLRLEPVFAISAAVLITFPNNLMYKTNVGHINFFALYYLPCVVLLGLWGIEDFPRVSPWSLARIATAAMLFGLLFATAYYVAWMFVLTAVIAACVAGVMLRRDLIIAIRIHARPAGLLVGAALAGFAVGIIPLLLIYVPVLAIVPGRSFRDYIGLAPLPKDVIDVSEWNLLWGWLIHRLLGDGGAERPLAVTPGMAAIFLALAYRLGRGTGLTDAGLPKTGSYSSRPWQLRFATICAAVFALSWVLTAKVGSLSLFWLPFQLMPGAGAIRAGERVQLIVNIWVVFGLAISLQFWRARVAPVHRRSAQVLTIAVLAFCLVEQINLFPARALSRSRDFAWFAAISVPPPACEAFFVDIRTRPSNDEVDAMWIALKTGLPTLNGTSGWTPPGWRLEDPGIAYQEAVRLWMAGAKIKEQICRYELPANSWSKFK
jgi:hypothetical protein